MILFKTTKIWEEGGGQTVISRAEKDKEYDQHCPLHPRKSILMCGKYKSSKMCHQKL